MRDPVNLQGPYGTASLSLVNSWSGLPKIGDLDTSIGTMLLTCVPPEFDLPAHPEVERALIFFGRKHQSRVLHLLGPYLYARLVIAKYLVAKGVDLPAAYDLFTPSQTKELHLSRAKTDEQLKADLVKYGLASFKKAELLRAELTVAGHTSVLQRQSTHVYPVGFTVEQLMPSQHLQHLVDVRRRSTCWLTGEHTAYPNP